MNNNPIKPKIEDELHKHRRYGMTLLQLMGAIALVGIVATIILSLFF